MYVRVVVYVFDSIFSDLKSISKSWHFIGESVFVQLSVLHTMHVVSFRVSLCYYNVINIFAKIICTKEASNTYDCMIMVVVY